MSPLDDPLDPPAGWQREHVHRYVATGGQDGHDWRGASVLLLTTAGRRSGRGRRTPLIYGRDSDRYIVVASKGGTDEPPLWLGNLLAHPRVRLQVRDEVFDAHARVATADERPRLWQLMTGIWPDYNAYQAKTSREIQVVVLEPDIAGAA